MREPKLGLDPALVLDCLPALQSCFENIPLNDEKVAREILGPYSNAEACQELTLYHLLEYSILNSSGTIRAGLNNLHGKKSNSVWIYTSGWFKENEHMMLKYCNMLALNSASYYFATHRPEALRAYLESGRFVICDQCMSKWHLADVLGDIVQTKEPLHCVLESGMRSNYLN